MLKRTLQKDSDKIGMAAEVMAMGFRNIEEQI